MSSTLEKIKEAADIVELISEFVPLKRSGASYVGLCPFHNDGKPSMHVSRQKEIYKCFSCGAGGDVFKFWSEYHQKEFKETIKDLADKYGIELDYSQEDKDKAEAQNLFVKMHELAADYYTQKLLASEEAEHCREYLRNRGITNATIERFRLGYSPQAHPQSKDQNEWTRIIRHLKEKLNVTEEQIMQAGLCNQSPKSSKFYDRFRGRLMIPICDERGRVIAFGARALKDPNTGNTPDPKYLNSPDSPIYLKGNNLYGMHLAKDAIRKEDSVIIVEGYFDQTTAYEAGVCNVVANQGTALTPRQAKLLTKFSDSKRIYLCFDMDKAGETATERAIETIMQNTKGVEAELRIIRVPEGKDPDELIRFGGVEQFRKSIEEAPLIIDYQIDRIIAKHSSPDQSIKKASPLSKIQIVKELAKYLKYVSSQLERSEYIKIIAERIEVDAALLNSELQSSDDNANPYQEPKPKPIQRNEHKQSHGHALHIEDGLITTEQEFLLLALQEQEILEDFMGQGLRLFSDSANQILDAITDVTFENPDITELDEKFHKLKRYLLAYPEFSEKLANIAMALEEEGDKTDTKTRYQDVLLKLKRHSLYAQMKEIVSEIKSIEDDLEAAQRWEELQKQKQEIVKQLQAQAPSP